MSPRSISTSRDAVVPSRRTLLAAGLGAAAAALLPRAARAHAGELHGADDHLSVKTVRLGPAPDVPLVSMQGEPRRFERVIDASAPLVMNFVFTTCSTTCSMQTAVLAELQRRCAAGGQPLKLVSLTIDPDNDTPEQLRRFASTFHVQAGWEFLTGRFDDLLRLQQHFDVYRGAKVAHPSVVLMRRSVRAPWQRVEGMPSAAELQALLRALPGG